MLKQLSIFALITLAGFLPNPAVSLTDLAYEYGPDGQLTGIIDNLDPSASKTISYDALNRLVQVGEGVPASQGGVPVPVEDYAYDQEGNRTASHLSNLYSSNDHNQLLSDDSYTYAYDDKGNRVSRTAKAGGAVETYGYDSQNRLVGYTDGTTTATYAYDAMERRISKTVDGTVTAYVYDMSSDDPLAHDDILLEFDATTSPTILTRRWAHSDSVDEPLGFEAYNASGGPGTGTERAIFADRQGSVIWVTEPASGAVVAAYEYDGYGQITQTQGALVQPYGYTGREYDSESGLYHYRARAYDPRTGVFVQSDPIGFASGTQNIYGYTENSTYNWNDPTGLNVGYVMGLARSATGSGGAAFSMFAGTTGSLLMILQALQNPIEWPVPATIPGQGTTADPGPPGNCKQDFHDKIKSKIEKLKATPHKCTGETQPFERLFRANTASRLYFWRSFLMNVCFNGGNSGHREAAQHARRARDRCLGF